VAELFALFLAAVKVERSEHTYLDYQRWLTEFAKRYGRRKARDITKGEANDFKRHLLTATWKRGKQPPQPYEPKTINHALVAVRRAFNWAIQNDYLPDRNPFARIKLLPRKFRCRLMTEAEYQALLGDCRSEAFRDVLIACRFTDARPAELRRLKWSMVDWENKLWLLPVHKTTSTSRRPVPRVIGMNATVVEVLARRRAAFPDSEYVFLNGKGRPWKRTDLVLRMRRLRAKAGIPPDANGERLTMYCNRRTFATRMAEDPTIPEAVRTQALGHTNPETTHDYYLRLQAGKMAEATRKVADDIARQRDKPGM
jgi:integrase